MSKERFKIRSAVYLILVKDDEVCLIKRADDNDYLPGSWFFPAGHLDGNETPREAMIREAKEEIGIDINIEDLYEPLTMNRLSLAEEYFDLFFVCDKWSGNVSNMEIEKASKVEWFKIDEIPKEFPDYCMVAFQALMNGVKYLEYDWDKRES